MKEGKFEEGKIMIDPSFIHYVGVPEKVESLARKVLKIAEPPSRG